jgi:roadblock/LC7 domain-containing protein
MRLIDIDKLNRLDGVTASALVDSDGLVIVKSGRISETTAPLLSRLISTWQSDPNIQGFGWREIHHDDFVYMLYPSKSCTLILICETDSNFGKIRVSSKPYLMMVNEMGSETFYESGVGLVY